MIAAEVPSAVVEAHYTQYADADPHWVRSKLAAKSWHSVDQEGYPIDLWSDVDIDVSFDGKHWMHALGRFCRGHNPPFVFRKKQDK